MHTSARVRMTLITKEDTCMREAIPPAERVALTLRFLATGESCHWHSFQFRISRQAISYIVEEVCDAIAQVIGEWFMQVPSSREDWLLISTLSHERWNFPNCLGAIDGKHIEMGQPAALSELQGKRQCCATSCCRAKLRIPLCRCWCERSNVGSCKE